MDIRAEVPQGHKRPRAGVDHLVAGRRGVGRDEQLVGGHLAEADKGRRGDVVDTHLSLPLDRDPAARSGILDGDPSPRFERQLLSAEQLPAVDLAVDDPAIVGPAVGALRVEDRLEVVGFLEVGVDILLPVELPDDEVEIVVLLLRHVFDEQAPRHRPPLDERLEHREHITPPLRLVGQQRARGVEDARRNQPASAALQSVGLGEIDDPVVAAVPVLEAAADILLRGPRFEAHEGVGEVVVAVVVLRREVVALRLPFVADELGVIERLVHVMGDRPHVVEELRVHRPLLVAVPDPLADELRLPLGDGVPQQETLPLVDTPRQPLVDDAPLVGGFGRTCKPTLVDPAPVEAVGVVVVGVEADPLAGVEEAPRHPGGGEPQHATAGVHRLAEGGADILGCGEIGGRGSGHAGSLSSGSRGSWWRLEVT